MEAYKLLAKLRLLTLVPVEEVECHHQCTSNCRREGCNCECGEYHEEDREKFEWVGSSKAWEKLPYEEESILRDAELAKI